MVVGQSLGAYLPLPSITTLTQACIVLYSRLHIIVIANKRLLDFVFWMILVNGFILYIPTTTLNFGTIVKMTPPYIDGYNIVERIQMTLVCFTTRIPAFTPRYGSISPPIAQLGERR